MLNFLLKTGLVITRRRNVDPQERMKVVLSRELDDIDLFVDIGANSGQTYIKARELGYLATYLAIEPEQTSFNKLKDFQIKDRAFFCERFAVGAGVGKVRLRVANNNALSSSILDFGASHLAAAPAIKMVETQEVPMKKLSDLLEHFKQKNIFLKIDVQGFEKFVLNGIHDADWKRIKGALIECNLVDSYEGSSLIEEIFSIMRSKDFIPYRIENGFGEANFGQQLQVDVLFRKAKR